MCPSRFRARARTLEILNQFSKDSLRKGGLGGWLRGGRRGLEGGYSHLKAHKGAWHGGGEVRARAEVLAERHRHARARFMLFGPIPMPMSMPIGRSTHQN